VAEVDPEMLFLMPCGYHLSETVREWARTTVPPWLAELPAVRRGAVFALDGSAYFSRPGPRVIDGIEMLAEIMDPEGFVDIAPPGGWTPVPVG
jgi:iron complex transport system substrate-binding protein